MRAERGQKVIPLHIGDTYIPIPSPMVEPVPGEDSDFGVMLNRYGDTIGEAPLRKLLVEKVKSRNRLPVKDIDCIQVTGGATSGLEAGFSRLLKPNAEILVLAPYWTILRHVADQARVKLVEVPFFDLLEEDKQFDAVGQLSKYMSEDTAAIYVNTPSNPTGMVLKTEQLEIIADFARENDLWIFSDEAYEDYIYDDSEHVSIGSLPNAFQHTVSVYTFSKSFGVSGMRVGYTVASPPVIAEINRGIVGSYYQVGRYDQLMAWRGLLRFEECLMPLYNRYLETWRWAAGNIRAKTLPCKAGFYFFLWLGEDWKGLDSEEKVSRMLDAGVVLSPGESFGKDYNGWARLCFTVVAPEDLKVAVHRLNELLA